MPYLLKLTKNAEESTRFAATAVEALVLIETYVANGYSMVAALDTADNGQVTIEELSALAGKAPG